MDVGLDKASFQIVRDAARAHAPDRYLAALLAPRAYREELIILAAFLGEIERIPRIVREPALGEIRLQWWVDWLENTKTATATGNPLADAMTHVIRKRQLPLAPLSDLLEARVDDFYADPVASQSAFEAYLDRTDTGPFQLAAMIAGVSREDALQNVLIPAARAYGATRCLLRLPYAISRGRWPLPVDELGDIDVARLSDPGIRQHADQARRTAIDQIRSELARAGKSRLPRDLMAVLLPAALIEPYLHALQKEDDWLHTPVEISPLTRAWRLWRAWRLAKL